MKKLLMGIALLGAFSFASADTNAGKELSKQVKLLTDNQIASIVRYADGNTGVTVTKNVSFVGYNGQLSIVNQVGVSMQWIKEQTSGLSEIDAWKAYNDTAVAPGTPPWGGNHPWIVYGVCASKTDGKAISWYFKRDGTPAPGNNAYGGFVRSGQAFEAGNPPTGQHTVSTSPGTSITTVNSWITSKQTSECAVAVTLTQWMDGSYNGGSPHSGVKANVRGGIVDWIKSVHDVDSSWDNPSGVTFAPALTPAQSEQCDSACQADTPGNGGDFDGDDGSSAEVPIDTGTNCSILDIPCNLRKLFVPTLDVSDLFNETKTQMMQKAPFGYLALMAYGGGVYCDFGILGEFVPDVEQGNNGDCYLGVVRVHAPGHGVVPGVPEYIQFNAFDNPYSDWMHDVGRGWLWIFLVAMFIYKCVVFAFSSMWVKTDDN